MLLPCFPDGVFCFRMESITLGKKNLPHKAVAEVSKDKEPIGRGACGVQLVRKSSDVRFKRVEIQMILVVC